MKIVTLRGGDLDEFLYWIQSEFGFEVFDLKIAIDTDGVKIKVNEGTWTQGIGKVES